MVDTGCPVIVHTVESKAYKERCACGMIVYTVELEAYRELYIYTYASMYTLGLTLSHYTFAPAAC
jgi:hypothetical protein